MKLSVVIPCYNAAVTLAMQLGALADQTYGEQWEVIIADNGSTDGTRAIVEQYLDRLPNLQWVDASDRKGAAHARNVGACAAHSDLLAFIDADDVAAPGWAVAITDAIQRDSFVCSRFEFDRLNDPWTVQVRAQAQHDDVQTYKYPPFLPHAGGCGLGIRRVLHEAVGGFDEALPALEDTDYCFRVQLDGTPLRFAREAIVHIRYRSTLSGIYDQARLWGKTNVLLYKRYRPLGMPALSWRSGVQAWWEIAYSLPFQRSRLDFARWLWTFGWRSGRLQGCLEYRVLAL
ncbi:MAG: glycosyltransferase [Anaerolineales bacterium]